MKKQQRACWKPIVKRGDGAVTNSKFAGTPWLGRKEKWPRCGSCKKPLRFGDGGRGYILQCPSHKDSLAFEWDCY